MPMDTVFKELAMVSISIILYCIFLYVVELSSKYRDGGESPNKETLLITGYHFTFGIVAASPLLIILLLLIFLELIYDFFKDLNYSYVLAFSGIAFVIIAIVFNHWGKKFLAKRGLFSKENYKGFYKQYREELEKIQAKHREKEKNKAKDKL